MEKETFDKLLQMLEESQASYRKLELARAEDNARSAAQIAELTATIVRLEALVGTSIEKDRLNKIKKNSNNSSIPPSKDENRKRKNTSLRVSSGKKSGGQHGHPGSTLLMRATPDIVENHRPDHCKYCGLDLQQTEPLFVGHRQVIDIPAIIPHVTEHRIFSKSCRCGKSTSASFPQHVNAPVSYGVNINAQVAYLHSRQFMPYVRMVEFLDAIYGIKMSQGTIDNILRKVAHKATQAYELIKAKVAEAAVVGADETGVNIAGKKAWYWVWQCLKATYITFSENRGSATLNNEFPDGFEDSILVHDCFAVQLKTNAALHQICTAHLLLDLAGLDEKYDHSWVKEFR